MLRLLGVLQMFTVLFFQLFCIFDIFVIKNWGKQINFSTTLAPGGGRALTGPLALQTLSLDTTEPGQG